MVPHRIKIVGTKNSEINIKIPHHQKQTKKKKRKNIARKLRHIF